jgi:hypothetical protein
MRQDMTVSGGFLLGMLFDPEDGGKHIPLKC